MLLLLDTDTTILQTGLFESHVALQTLAPQIVAHHSVAIMRYISTPLGRQCTVRKTVTIM